MLRKQLVRRAVCDVLRAWQSASVAPVSGCNDPYRSPQGHSAYVESRLPKSAPWGSIYYHGTPLLQTFFLL